MAYSVGNNNFSYTSDLRTTDATQSILDSVQTENNGSYQVKAFIHAKKPATMDVGGWEITGTFKNISGTASLVGTLDIIANQDQSWDATLSVSGNKITCLVTGAAASAIIWHGELQVKRLELAY